VEPFLISSRIDDGFLRLLNERVEVRFETTVGRIVTEAIVGRKADRATGTACRSKEGPNWNMWNILKVGMMVDEDDD
jgi:hypothetical protein